MPGRPCIGPIPATLSKDGLGQYLITYVPNGSCIGLTDRSGHRLNGKETEFFVAQSKDAAENPGSQSRPDGQGRGVAPGGVGAFPLGRQIWTRGRG